VRWQLADVEFIQRGHPLVREEPFLFCTLVGTLPDEKNKDLYDLYKNNIVGGPSIVFHRYHEKDKTFIRPTEYTDPKPCQLIYGVLVSLQNPSTGKRFIPINFSESLQVQVCRDAPDF
jgi:hypothetical protein